MVAGPKDPVQRCSANGLPECTPRCCELPSCEASGMRVARLHYREQILEIASKLARLGGWVVDLAENRVVWSDQTAEIHEMPHGYSPSVEQGISFYAPEHRSRITEAFSACANEGKRYDEELQIITSTGRRVWVRTIGIPVRDDTGKIVRVEGGFQDITERKRIEAALRESETFTRTVLDHLPIGVAVNSVGADGRFSYVNDNFVKIYRTTREALSRPGAFWDVVYDDAALREQLRKRVREDIASGDPSRMVWQDIEICREGEPTTYVSARNYPIPNGPWVISMVWDVTQRKMAEDKVREQIGELNRWHRVTLGREARILELKREVNQLLEQLGRPAKYSSAE